MTDCSICLENIETDMFVTKCGHKFHKNCSEQLKASGHHKCPMCREVIFDVPRNIINFENRYLGAFIFYDIANNNNNENQELENTRIIAENVFHAVFDNEEGAHVIRNLLDAFNQANENQQ